MDVMQAITERRSVRKYKPDPVPEEYLRTVLEAARWAPSWANTQCWRFVLVTSPEAREKLAQALSPGNPAADAVRAAPVVVVACAELGKAGYLKREDGPATDKGDWFMYDVALAMQNLTLAAHSLGLGTVHVGLFDAQKVAETIGIVPGMAVVALTPLGFPDQQPAAPRRRELSDIAFRERYPQPWPASTTPSA